MNLLSFLYLPAGIGLLCLIIPKNWRYVKEIVASLGGFVFLIISYVSFSLPQQFQHISWFQIPPLDFAFDFRLYHFSRFLLIFLGLFTFLTTLYSTYYFRKKDISPLYYPFLLWTLCGSAAIVLADNLFVLLLGWELVTLLLFFLIAMGKGKPAAMAAGKAFAILGFTDVALLLGVIATPLVYGTWQISALKIVVGDPLSIVIFLLMFTAAIAKAGAMPFHSWIPTAAQDAPLPVVAFLPGSLDKLLGIYLLARLMLDVFQINHAILLIMLIIGAITLIAANLMALVQNDLKKFLGFATVTQVGFMLIGFGSGTAIGILGGLFHMLNHAIYKTLLFFGAGVVETETGTTDMNQLGGLAGKMPFTFAAMTIGIMAASGIPPFNAFVSKWMIYQATLTAGLPLFMIIAMFGSALTLATFLKMWTSTFMGNPAHAAYQKVKDGTIITRFVLLIPALLCIIFGIFAQLPVNKYIAPILSFKIGSVPHTINIGSAFYNPTLATVLLLLGLVLGTLVFLLGRMPTRTVETFFIGGEKFEIEKERFLADHFYETIQRMKLLGTLLREGGKGIFDIYNISSDLGLILVNVLKKLHDGVLSTYLAWCIIGLGVLSFVLIAF